MIADPNGKKITLVPNGLDALGVPEMFRNKEYIVTLCVERPGGSHFVHCKDGREFTVPTHITIIENL